LDVAYSAEERRADDPSVPDVLQSDVTGPDAGVASQQSVARQPSSPGASQMLAADVAAGTLKHF